MFATTNGTKDISTMYQMTDLLTKDELHLLNCELIKCSKKYNLMKDLPVDHVLVKTFMQTRFAATRIVIVSTIIKAAKSHPTATPDNIVLTNETLQLLNTLHNKRIITGFVIDNNLCTNVFELYSQNKSIGQSFAKNNMKNVHSAENYMNLCVKDKIIPDETKLQLQHAIELTPEVTEKDINTAIMSFNTSKAVLLKQRQAKIQKDQNKQKQKKLEPIPNNSNNNDTSTQRKKLQNRFKAIRYLVQKIAGNYCYCCGARPGDKIDNEHVIMSGDHILPFCDNEHLRIELLNVQILCQSCNEIKGSNDTTDWRTTEQKQKLIEHRYKYITNNELEQELIIKHHTFKITQTAIAKHMNIKPYQLSRTYCNIKSLLAE